MCGKHPALRCLGRRELSCLAPTLDPPHPVYYGGRQSTIHEVYEVAGNQLCLIHSRGKPAVSDTVESSCVCCVSYTREPSTPVSHTVSDTLERLARDSKARKSDAVSQYRHASVWPCHATCGQVMPHPGLCRAPTCVVLAPWRCV